MGYLPKGRFTFQYDRWLSANLYQHWIHAGASILFDRGDEIVVQAGERGVRFLFVSGKPIEEPVAWRGPIVMNTQEELRDAFRELREGTFIRP